MRYAEHVVQGKRYRAIFDGDRCVSFKVWVKAGLGHWRHAPRNGEKADRAIAFLRQNGNDWR